MEQQADERLIASYLRGNAGAAREIEQWIVRAMTPYRRSLHREWEDAIQECHAHVAGLLREGRFRGESSLATYLWRVVNCLCIDRLRVRSRFAALQVETAQPLDPVDPAEGPLERLLRMENRQAALDVLREMPRECVDMWRMIVAGQSYREMSERLGVREGALRVRVLRCRQRASEMRERMRR